MIGNERTSPRARFRDRGVDENLTVLPLDSFKAMVERVAEAYPNLR